MQCHVIILDTTGTTDTFHERGKTKKEKTRTTNRTRKRKKKGKKLSCPPAAAGDVADTTRTS